MIDTLDVVLVTLTVLFAIAYLVMAKKFINVSKKNIRLSVDNAVMQEYIDIVKSNEESFSNDELVHKENFIKFLSDSRDWAFEYIENVQDGLTKFISEVDAHIEYFDKYGDVLANNMPDNIALKQISKSYKELKKLMPEDEEVTQ
jgi:hypothetical protein